MTAPADAILCQCEKPRRVERQNLIAVTPGTVNFGIADRAALAGLLDGVARTCLTCLRPVRDP